MSKAFVWMSKEENEISVPGPERKIHTRVFCVSVGKFRAQKKGKLLPSHRSTIYPCFVPNLGDLTGAGRERLTRGKSR